MMLVVWPDQNEGNDVSENDEKGCRKSVLTEFWVSSLASLTPTGVQISGLRGWIFAAFTALKPAHQIMPNAVSTKIHWHYHVEPKSVSTSVFAHPARAHDTGLDVWAASGGPDSERRRLECGSRDLWANLVKRAHFKITSSEVKSATSESTNLASGSATQIFLGI